MEVQGADVLLANPGRTADDAVVEVQDAAGEGEGCRAGAVSTAADVKNTAVGLAVVLTFTAPPLMVKLPDEFDAVASVTVFPARMMLPLTLTTPVAAEFAAEPPTVNEPVTPAVALAFEIKAI